MAFRQKANGYLVYADGELKTSTAIVRHRAESFAKQLRKSGAEVEIFSIHLPLSNKTIHNRNKRRARTNLEP